VTASTIATQYAFAADLLSVCEAALVATTGGAIGRAYVSPGLPALDCELIAVTCTGLMPKQSNSMPAGRLARDPSVNMLAFAVTVTRDCQPVVANQYGGPNAPTVAQLQAAAQILSEDVWAIWNAIPAAARTGALFEGRCSFLYLDQAFALAEQGGIGGWQIDVHTQIDGF